MEGGLVMPNPCRAHSPPGLTPAFLCLPIIPLPTGPNAGLSKGEALATPLWLSSADLFIPVWRKLMHFNMIFFGGYSAWWRLLLKVIYAMKLFCHHLIFQHVFVQQCVDLRRPQNVCVCFQWRCARLFREIRARWQVLCEGDGLFCKTALTD